MQIDLRSDTVTKPSPAMLQAMLTAPVGDDVFSEDPTVNLLEQKAAEMFGKQAALFCPSGTMTNQIAIKTHTQPLDEVICHKQSHIYKYETGGWAYHSGVSIKLIDGERGILTSEKIEENIQPTYDWLPHTSLVVAENTVNAAGGSIYTLPQLQQLFSCCKANQLKFHLDGARLFNAIVESDYTPQDIGKITDSISICLSKGLGAPIGSLLIGDAIFIKQARRIRKVMGGGMRQAGILAAAGIYALKNNVERLKEDHTKIKKIAAVLQQRNYVEKIYPPETNILIFETKPNKTANDFIQQLEQHNVKAIAFGKHLVRLVTHLDFSNEMCNKVCKVLPTI